MLEYVMCSLIPFTGMWSSIFSVNLLQIWGLSHSSEDFWKRWTQDKIEEVGEKLLSLSFIFINLLDNFWYYLVKYIETSIRGFS